MTTVVPHRIFALMSKWPAVALAAALVLGVPNASTAHEIPSSVTILAFVKPEARRLRFVVRVPLEAIRDIKWPLRGPGYLELGKVSPLLPQAVKLWIADNVRMYEDDKQLPAPTIVSTRLSLPSDRSFTTYDAAVANMHAAGVDSSTDLAWQQAMLDAVLEYPITSPSANFSIDPALARLGVRTMTVLRFIPYGGSERAFQYMGDPGLVRLDPRWYQAALNFASLGFRHILSGFDHLLFIFCLVIPFRRIRPLVAVVTAFTIAHSITLIASAAGFAPDALWFPPLIEVLIAASIVYMALENIVGAKLERRWLVAFGFGLVHGFGFSFALRESLQFAGAHLATSLVSFNVGVELGQLLVIALAVPAVTWAFKHVVAERMGTIILSAFVAHTAWHWMMDRGATLSAYTFQMPALSASFAASVMRGMMFVLLAGGLAWVLFGLSRRWAGKGDAELAVTRGTR
jgi:hypothetical protein